jgi:hypothetical protein
MSSPNVSPRDMAAQLLGQDYVTQFLVMKHDLDALRRNLNQSGKTSSWTVSTPTMPASTVAVSNDNSVPVTVYIRGGTVTVVTIQGVALSMTGGTFRVNPGDTIAITYSAAPTWFWYGD